MPRMPPVPQENRIEIQLYILLIGKDSAIHILKLRDISLIWIVAKRREKEVSTKPLHSRENSCQSEGKAFPMGTHQLLWFG